jgi:predicted esterase
MKRILLFCLISLGMSAFSFGQKDYTLVVEGFDWGPAVSKVILHLDGEVTENPDAAAYQVLATRTTDRTENPITPASGQRDVLAAYVSDASGTRTESGKYVTLILEVGPTLRIASPFHYQRGNFWVDYRLLISNTQNLTTWDNETDRIIPLVDEYDLTGVYKGINSQKEIHYASYSPKSGPAKKPLLIWLHGGGEGGTDTTIPLLGNRAANYASDEIQNYFGAAYVLVPQSPTRWMDSGNGSTSGQVDDIYFKDVKGLIDEFTKQHPDIDKDRIYVGGCSNGGYISFKLLLEYPKYFAGAYISALAYRDTNVTDQQIKSIKHIPIWFVHSNDDTTTVPENTVLPIYKRLIAGGAKNVHLSYYDHVVDITNAYGGKNFHYPGHWSWIYSHANESYKDFDGKPVMAKGVPVTIMQWLALQKN